MKITQIVSCMVFGSKTAANQPYTNIKDEQNMSPVYLFKCTPMSLVTKATIHKDEQCWLYKRPLYWFKCTPMYLPPMPSRGSPIQNLLWPNGKAELTANVNSAPTREHGFSYTIRHGSQDTGEINFVVSSITMYNMWCMLWHNMLY
jgi:hypothetical protein